MVDQARLFENELWAHAMPPEPRQATVDLRLVLGRPSFLNNQQN